MTNPAAARRFDESFADDVLHGLAAIPEEELEGDSLLLALSMSLWMRRRGLSFSEAVNVLLLVRRAVIDCTPLDRGSEPVPLLHPDTRTTLLNLSSYLRALIARAGRVSGTTRCEIADRTVSMLLAS